MSPQLEFSLGIKLSLSDGQEPFLLSLHSQGGELDLSKEPIQLLPGTEALSLQEVKQMLFPNLPALTVYGLKVGYSKKEADPDGLYLKGNVMIGEQVVSFNLDSTEEEEIGNALSKIKSTTTNGPAKKIEINKSFGPVKIQGIGLSAEDFTPKFAIDISFEIAGLTFGLLGLGARFPIQDFPRPQPALDGLELVYNKGAMQIAGTFFKGEGMNFAGSATITAKAFNLVALGGLDANSKDPSFFLYALYNKPLGGPSFFHVTGLAAGLGINRKLNIPPVDQVENFPLVKVANGKASENSDLLTSLQEYLPASPGNLWMAAGVRFTSFKLMETFALLTVSLGDKFQVDLLGVSTLKVPQKGNPYVFAKMLLKASFAPEDGLLGIEARLAQGSYILQNDCRISGGFAFFQWFDNSPYAGDFVVSWGGYHPSYRKPAHYPNVPRLSLHWSPTRELTVKGGAYMAITPGALMAGGRLEAVWQKGHIRAWFNLEAHFLMNWHPFRYEGTYQVSIGASFTIKVLFARIRISISVHIQVKVWGPKFSGQALIDLDIISFTIPFGHSSSRSSKISFKEFKANLLPKEDELITITPVVGLLRDLEAEQKEQDDAQTDAKWVIDPQHFVIEVSFAIPFNKLIKSGIDQQKKEEQSLTNFYARPVGSDVESAITWERKNISPYIKAEPIKEQQPAALWGDPKNGKEPNSGHLVSVYKKIRILPGESTPGKTRLFHLDELLYESKFNTENEAIWQQNKLPLSQSEPVADLEYMSKIYEGTAKTRKHVEDLREAVLFEDLLMEGKSIHLDSFKKYKEGRFWNRPMKYNSTESKEKPKE